MKLPFCKTLYSSLFVLALTGSAFASHTETMVPTTASGKVYIGIFGGGGSTSSTNASQFGTAFYEEAVGGPLAVDAFGDTDNRSAWLFGAQIGYQAQDRVLSPDSHWTLAPAVELEGYSFSNKTFTGNLTNETPRLPEHDFIVTYPTSRNVFLGNFVLNFNNPCYLLHPYIGLGIGDAILRIAGADGAQVQAPEPGINHYNASDSDTVSTFAGQVKAGLSYDINKCTSLFIEYRWLYLASTHFIFGSTVYPTHVETSPWQVKLDPQRSNLGTIGIRFNL